MTLSHSAKRIKKIIWSALLRYNSADLKTLKAKGYWEDLQAEVAASVYAIQEQQQDIFRACMDEANKIRKNFIRAILPRYDYIKPYARRNLTDFYLLNSVETLYKLGGAEWCYFLFKPKEKWPGHFKALLSQCFKGGKDNSRRNAPERKIFLQKIKEGYAPRVSGSGSIYLEMGASKIRFSDHEAEIELLYRDITENYILSDTHIINNI